MSLIPYKTLMKRGESMFIVNKSRFIGYGAPAQTEEEALDFLKEIRTRHKDATHNCFAYIIGANMGVMRYSDDGEPGGTAGLPIIEVMKARGVTHCCVVVTRYFGGVLLGAGGLVRAYSQGSAAAIDASDVGVMHPTTQFIMDVPYNLLGRVEHFLKDQPVIVTDKTFADVVTLTAIVRTADETVVTEQLVQAMDGRIEPIWFDERYMPWREE